MRGVGKGGLEVGWTLFACLYHLTPPRSPRSASLKIDAVLNKCVLVAALVHNDYMWLILFSRLESWWYMLCDGPLLRAIAVLYASLSLQARRQ